MQGYIPRRAKNVIVRNIFEYALQRNNQDCTISQIAANAADISIVMEFKVYTQDGRRYTLNAGTLHTQPHPRMTAYEKNSAARAIFTVIRSLMLEICETEDEYLDVRCFLCCAPDGEWLIFSEGIVADIRARTPAIITDLLEICEGCGIAPVLPQE